MHQPMGMPIHYPGMNRPPSGMIPSAMMQINRFPPRQIMIQAQPIIAAPPRFVNFDFYFSFENISLTIVEVSFSCHD